MKRMRYQLKDYFGKTKKVNCEGIDFSFRDDQVPSGGDIAKIARAWEIVADLGKRIADAKNNPEQDTLRLTAFSKRGLDGEMDGNYVMYRFNFTVNGDLNTIRRVAKNLYDAYKENRFYAIRDIKLTRTVDGVQDIIEESERIKEELDYEGSEKDIKDDKRAMLPNKRRFGSSPENDEKNKILEARKKLKEKIVVKKKRILGPKDRDYAKIIIGRNNICTAEFEVDYIVFDNSSK
jgi:hypothetical protein